MSAQLNLRNKVSTQRSINRYLVPRYPVPKLPEGIIVPQPGVAPAEPGKRTRILNYLLDPRIPSIPRIHVSEVCRDDWVWWRSDEVNEMTSSERSDAIGKLLKGIRDGMAATQTNIGVCESSLLSVAGAVAQSEVDNFDFALHHNECGKLFSEMKFHQATMNSWNLRYDVWYRMQLWYWYGDVEFVKVVRADGVANYEDEDVMLMDVEAGPSPPPRKRAKKSSLKPPPQVAQELEEEADEVFGDPDPEVELVKVVSPQVAAAGAAAIARAAAVAPAVASLPKSVPGLDEAAKLLRIDPGSLEKLLTGGEELKVSGEELAMVEDLDKKMPALEPTDTETDLFFTQP
jgi:hypothetical protein